MRPATSSQMTDKTHEPSSATSAIATSSTPRATPNLHPIASRISGKTDATNPHQTAVVTFRRFGLTTPYEDVSRADSGGLLEVRDEMLKERALLRGLEAETVDDNHHEIC